MNKYQNPITDEVIELTGDILKHYNKGKFENMEKIVDELTPKLKKGVIQYLNGFITYINGWSDNDSEKKWKLKYFKIVKEIVKNTHYKEIWDTKLLKEIEETKSVDEEVEEIPKLLN